MEPLRHKDKKGCKEFLCESSRLRGLVVQNFYPLKHIISVLIFSVSVLAASAQVKLPRLLRDSMVLQRDTKLNIWGWASAGEKVSVRFNNKTYKTTTGKNGKWIV